MYGYFYSGDGFVTLRRRTVTKEDVFAAEMVIVLFVATGVLFWLAYSTSVFVRRNFKPLTWGALGFFSLALVGVILAYYNYI